MSRVPEHARRHILTAMVWGVEGYDPTSVLTILSAGGDQQVSEAVQWLAFTASHSAGMPLDTATGFWRLVIEAQLRPNAYEGFGWLASVERLDPDMWLDLMLAAAHAAKGQLEQANHIASRAAEHPNDERAILLVTALLDADLKLWYLEDVGRAARDAPVENRETEAARAELRERLLEREFFDAYGKRIG